MAKKELTITEFRAIIKEEALKLKSKMVLENEKKALKEELKSLLGESYIEECGAGYEEEGMVGEAAMEELFGSGKRKEANMKSDFITYAKAWKAKGAIRGMNQAMLDDLMAQAAADNFAGKPGIDAETKLMSYRAGGDVNWAGSGNPQGGSFAG